MINTLIADSQYLTTISLQILIDSLEEYSNSGQAESYSKLQLLLKSNSFDLLIADYDLIDLSSPDDLRQILIDYPKLPVLIVTNHINRNEAHELTGMGIKNIIYKTSGPDEILAAMNATVRKKKYFSGEVLDLLIQRQPQRGEIHESINLTQSEKDIVKLIADGLTTKEIAFQKHISFHTVMTHRKNIFRKLNVNNASELLMHAVRTGLIENIEYYI